MTTNPNAPHFVLAAVKRIYSDLPSLVGTDSWTAIQPQVDTYIATMESQANTYLASTQLFGLLAQHEPARQRMAQELTIQGIVAQNIAAPMEQLAASLNIDPNLIDFVVAAVFSHMQWEVDPTTIPTADQDVRLKGITLSEGGIGGATVTFRKLQIDLGDLPKIAAGLITTILGIMAAPAMPAAIPLAVTAAFLSTVGALYDSTKLDLSEQEASVLWGMIQATGEMRGAGLHEDIIMTTTNTERALYGLGILNEAQIRHSLSKLNRIKCIEKTNRAYRIIEGYTIKE